MQFDNTVLFKFMIEHTKEKVKVKNWINVIIIKCLLSAAFVVWKKAIHNTQYDFIMQC